MPLENSTRSLAVERRAGGVRGGSAGRGWVWCPRRRDVFSAADSSPADGNPASPPGMGGGVRTLRRSRSPRPGVPALGPAGVTVGEVTLGPRPVRCPAWSSSSCGCGCWRKQPGLPRLAVGVGDPGALARGGPQVAARTLGAHDGRAVVVVSGVPFAAGCDVLSAAPTGGSSCLYLAAEAGAFPPLLSGVVLGTSGGIGGGGLPSIPTARVAH